MKVSRLLAFLAAILVGCSSSKPGPVSASSAVAGHDPIDCLSAELTNMPPESVDVFPNGLWSPIHLPATATTAKLVKKALTAEAIHSRFTIFETRKVRLACPGREGFPGTDYIAVLVGTHSGRKIVLLQYDAQNWDSQVYNVSHLLAFGSARTSPDLVAMSRSFSSRHPDYVIRSTRGRELSVYRQALEIDFDAPHDLEEHGRANLVFDRQLNGSWECIDEMICMWKKQ